MSSGQIGAMTAAVPHHSLFASLKPAPPPYASGTSGLAQAAGETRVNVSWQASRTGNSKRVRLVHALCKQFNLIANNLTREAEEAGDTCGSPRIDVGIVGTGEASESVILLNQSIPILYSIL